VRIGLDVTDGLGTGGPNGSLLDPGDNLGSYLPGETLHGGPVIKWDKYAKRLVPQRLSLRVETDGPVPYTNAVFRLGGGVLVSSNPGWCTNTRDPGPNDSADARANWDPHDFSLSEKGYLAVTNAPIVDGVAAVDLFCRDYGGKCKVYVDLQSTNSTDVTRSFTIPADSDSDSLADCWEGGAKDGWMDVFGTNALAAATSLFSASVDDEPADPDGPGDRAAHASEGDGLTPFEEYRGFSLPESGRAHWRLSPIRKEMLVRLEVAATNDVPVVDAAYAAEVAAAAATALSRDLDVRTLWSHAPPHPRDAHAGADAQAVSRSYAADADWAPLHTGFGLRRLVLSANLPPMTGHGHVMGMGNPGVALVDVARIGTCLEPTSSLGGFAARNGISVRDATKAVATHETGHVAGCRGDRVVFEDAPAVTVRSRFAPVAGRCEAWLQNDGPWTCLALQAEGIPPFDVSIPDLREFGTGAVWRTVFRLPSATLAAAADSQGLVLAYAARQERHEVVYWADCAPLAVPVAAPGPGVAGTNEWRSLVGYWATNGIPHGPAGMPDVLRDFPEFAPFFPGVVLDATLPEAFRIEFAERMPGATYDPAVFAFVTNAVDKTAPLVVAALRVLSRVSGTTPEQKAAVDAMGDAVYAMSQDAQHPLLFRLHAAHRFRSRVPYKEFRERTEPEFKLLAAHELRSAQGADFSNALRAELRAGLTTLSTDTTPFVAGPLAGKYPESATVGQVAAIILADLEAKWAAEPSWKD
jgi:hypothetical protein